MAHIDSKALLGVSFDNISLDEAAQKLLSMLNMYSKDGIARYTCTINVDCMMNAQSVNWNDVYDPELLEIYRKSQLATSDGEPLVWLSHALGSPLKERVSGIDLIFKMSELLAQHKKSIFLVGGKVKVNKVAGVVLEALNPGLQIAGNASPYVYTEGEELLDTDEQDALLVEEINSKSPDVLLIAFGNPKQEKWFNRIRHKLKVPISIGVGGSFDIISGELKRAPIWMQKVGMEWLYRLAQEPRRLWKRYTIDLLSFFCVALPLVCYHSVSRLSYAVFSDRKPREFDNPLLFLSPTQTLAMLPMPQLIDEEYCRFVASPLEEMFNQDTVVLDFGKVLHLTLEGFSLLLKIWHRANIVGKELYAINLSRDVRLLMKAHRVWDLVKDNVMENPQQILKALVKGKNHPDFFDSVQQNRDHTIIYFFGRIGAAQNTTHYVDKLALLVRGKDCILDFRYCTHIENKGFSFLLKLKEVVRLQKFSLAVQKRSKMITRLFRLSKVDHLFTNYQN